MAVAHRASAASGSTNPTTSMTITIPAGVQTGDFLICAFTSRDHTSGTGFATVTDDDSGGNIWRRFWHSADRKANLYWKIATSATASKTVTVGSCVGSCSGGVSAYSGAAAIGLAVGDLIYEANASGNETHASITPVSNDNEIVFCVFNYANDNAVTSVSGATIGALTSRWEKLSTGGNDCAATLWSVPQGTAGASGSITWSQTDGTTYSVALSIISTDVAFPTTSILDNFNRANEDPIAGGWSSTPIWNGVATGRILSNAYAVATDGNGHPFWNTSFSADQESGVTVSTATNLNVVTPMCRGANMNSGSFNPTFYSVECQVSSGFMRLYEVNAGAETELFNTSQAISSGDSVGLRCVGSRISAWYKASGGSWEKRLIVTNSVISAGGFAGMLCNSSDPSVTRWDDFFGGNYVPPAAGARRIFIT